MFVKKGMLSASLNGNAVDRLKALDLLFVTADLRRRFSWPDRWRDPGELETRLASQLRA